MTVDERYMRRALQIARKGEGNASPNPMVGAVIVDPSGRIIGEGYHRRCGEGHAEVNAVASVADESALADATMYVTLEPCSHYGKTPPCARLIIDKKIPRVVVGCLDPFEKVSGRGVQMLRDAGVEVEVLDGEISRECRDLNRRFMTAHRLRRPYITLKWAQSADGFMTTKDALGNPVPVRLSTPASSILVHRERSLHDAIITGSGTVEVDNPRLNVRGWHGHDPLRVILDRRSRLDEKEYKIFADSNFLHITGQSELSDVMAELYSRGITSALVEAGPTLLNAFIGAGLWDRIRVEVSPVTLGAAGAAKAPGIPGAPANSLKIDENTIYNIYNITS